VEIGEAEPSFSEKIDAILEGVEKGRVDALAVHLGLGKTETLEVIGLLPSSFSRTKGRLNRQASERVVLLEEVARVGEEAFAGDQGAFQDWFRSPNVLLGNQVPKDACKFTVGIQEVQRILARIATADFSA
jgi:putative toxin-antitoxin system antitoxin component (TIGR02293 family)